MKVSSKPMYQTNPHISRDEDNGEENKIEIVKINFLRMICVLNFVKVNIFYIILRRRKQLKQKFLVEMGKDF